jgi:subtilisin family serine protease
MPLPCSFMQKRVAYVSLAILGLLGCDDATRSLEPLEPSARQSVTDSPGPELIPNRYLVRFHDNVLDVDATARSVALSHQANVLYVWKAALKGMGIEIPDAAVAALRRNPRVAEVEQDRVAYLSTTQTGATWGLDRVDQRALPLNGSFTYYRDGTGVTAYIIDTGINFSHVDFGGRAVTGIDEITPGGTAEDCYGHGTHVAGTLGGATYGVAKNVQLVAVRVFNCFGGGSSEMIIVDAVNWVTANRTLPAVANMSLTLGSPSSLLNQAIANSANSGVVYTIAAGNCPVNGFGGCAQPPQSACNNSPANSSSGITVGATNINDGFAYFSYYGSCVALNAPGQDILSAWVGTPDTLTASGTSMAAPHVGGAAALFLQANPGSTPAQVKSALIAEATSGVISGLPGGTPNRLLYSLFIGGLTATFTGPSYTSYQQVCNWAILAAGGTPPYAYSIRIQSQSFIPNSTTSSALASRVYTTASTYVLVDYSVTDAAGDRRQATNVFYNVGYASDPYCGYQ